MKGESNMVHIGVVGQFEPVAPARHLLRQIQLAMRCPSTLPVWSHGAHLNSSSAEHGRYVWMTFQNKQISVPKDAC